MSDNTRTGGVRRARKTGTLQLRSRSPGRRQVEIDVQYCGICHSDLAMLNDEWHMTQYPFVPGHEAIGTVSGRGAARETGQRWGKRWGWAGMREAACACPPCLAGDQNMCRYLEQTIVGRHGAFATRVRCHWVGPHRSRKAWIWRSRVPCCAAESRFSIRWCSTTCRRRHEVGVIGIGGLGHMALQFLNKWGCDVTAFTSSAGKADEARADGRAPHRGHALGGRTYEGGRLVRLHPVYGDRVTWTGRCTSTRWPPKGICTWWEWSRSRLRSPPFP